MKTWNYLGDHWIK